jgi:hypothetical protein
MRTTGRLALAVAAPPTIVPGGIADPAPVLGGGSVVKANVALTTIVGRDGVADDRAGQTIPGPTPGLEALNTVGIRVAQHDRVRILDGALEGSDIGGQGRSVARSAPAP